VFQVTQIASIHEAEEEEWDKLAPSSPLSSHGWLRSIEQRSRPGHTHCFFLARDSAGLSVAFECKVELSGDPRASLGKVLFGEAAGIARAALLRTCPAVIIQKRLFRPGLPDEVRRRLGQAMIEAVEQMALEKCATVCFRQVAPEEESNLDELLSGRGYASSVDLPFTRLDLPAEWRSFADYQRHLKKLHPGMESSIRVELNRAKRHGLVIESVEDPRQFDRLNQLLNDHHLRLNQRPLPYGNAFLDALKANLGQRVTFSMASIQNEPVGVSIGIRAGSSMAFPLIGIDQERGRSAATYFNLGYNRNIEACIEQGIRLAHFGTYAYQTKVQRVSGTGASVVPTGELSAVLSSSFILSERPSIS